MGWTYLLCQQDRMAQEVQAESTKLKCFEPRQYETPANSHYALFSPKTYRMLQNLTNVD